MSDTLLMPKATAVWLVDNTALTFDQIAEFCGLHPLEVAGIADGEVAVGIKGRDPVAAGQLGREDLEKAEKDPSRKLKLLRSRVEVPTPSKKGPRYTPISRRQDRPDAINWLLRYHPELSDAQISKLVGTTKTTINAVRDRTHWNSSNLQLLDPVSLGLCTQVDLDAAVQKAAHRREQAQPPAQVGPGGTLLPASQTITDEPVAAGEDDAATAEDGAKPLTDEELTADPSALFNLPDEAAEDSETADEISSETAKEGEETETTSS